MIRTPVSDIFDPAFIPPHENEFVIRTLLKFVPWISRYCARIEQLTIGDQDLEKLRALHGSRAILVANHPTREDPIVLFWLSRMLGERFNFLAAREAMVGCRGWLMSRVGAYSILPGVCGTDSIRTTSRLLVQAQRKIVVFPEGDIDDCNPALLPFHSGAVQLGFWALEALDRSGQRLSLPIAPLALSYEYFPDAQQRIGAALARLEHTIRLPATPALSPQQRVARIHERIVFRLEASERLNPNPAVNVDVRVRAIRDSILRRVAGFLNVKIEGDGALQRQKLSRQLMCWTGLLGDPGAYLKRLHDHRVELALILNQDLQRLQNLEATAPAALNMEIALDRFVAIVERFELEVYGQVHLWPHRRAVVRLGEIVRLEDYYGQYRANRNETARAVTARIEDSIRAKFQPLLNVPSSLIAAPTHSVSVSSHAASDQAAADRTV
jgi:hypothetical protein